MIHQKRGTIQTSKGKNVLLTNAPVAITLLDNSCVFPGGEGFLKLAGLDKGDCLVGLVIFIKNGNIYPSVAHFIFFQLFHGGFGDLIDSAADFFAAEWLNRCRAAMPGARPADENEFIVG